MNCFYPPIRGPIEFCRERCPGGHLCYKRPGHKGRHTCIKAFGMRYPLYEQFPKTCCPEKKESEQVQVA